MSRTRAVIASGTLFGTWTVLGDARDRYERRVLCRCRCGAEHLVFAPDLLRGKSRGCIACGTEMQRGRPKAYAMHGARGAAGRFVAL